MRQPFETRDHHRWVVFIAAVAVGFFNNGFPVTMGSMYVSMLDTLNAGRPKTALVQSLTLTFCLGFGIVSGFLISRFGIKAISYLGAVLTVLGFLSSFFVTSIYHLYASISVVSGAGFNIMYVCAVLSIGQTFTGKQKSMAISVQSVGTAIAGLVWPHLLNYLLDSYALRGTYLILSSIFLHNTAFAIVFGKSKTEQGRLKNDITEVNSIEHNNRATELSKTNDYGKVHDNNIVGKHDVIKTQPRVAFGNSNDVLNVIQSEDQPYEHDKGDSTNENANIHKKFNTDHTSCEVPRLSLNSHTCKTTDIEEQPDPSLDQSNKDKTGISHEQHGAYVNRAVIESSADAGKYADTPNEETEVNLTNRYCGPVLVVFLTYILAGVLHMSTLAGLNTVYQDINVSRGLSIDQSDLTFTSYSITNILSRFLPLLIARTPTINSFTIPIISSLCGVVGQVVYLSTTSITSTFIAMAISGISDGGWVSSMQSITFEILPLEKQAIGYGFMLTAVGVSCAATGPIFGYLRDHSASYQHVHIITAAMYLVSALLDLLCLIKMNRYRNKCKETYKN